jgi:hypothetical protein
VVRVFSGDHSHELTFRFTDPLKYGDYPQLLKDIRGDVLPKFTEEEQALVKGSTDFLA